MHSREFCVLVPFSPTFIFRVCVNFLHFLRLWKYSTIFFFPEKCEGFVSGDVPLFDTLWKRKII